MVHEQAYERAEKLREELEEKGYRKYSPTSFDNESVVARYQKRFDDDKGKKYFIDVVEWKPFIQPYTREDFGPAFEFELQMYGKGTHNAINMTFHSSWELADVEAFVERQFATGEYDYYELWDE